MDVRDWWPATSAELIGLQERLGLWADEVRRDEPWTLPAQPVLGGCFIAFARGEAGPGGPGDRAWAGAVAWRAGDGSHLRRRSVDEQLRGVTGNGTPRRSSDLAGQAVVMQRVAAAYVPGLLALREGPTLAAAVDALDPPPCVVLVDATGLDHPRRAGLAIHVGAATDLPTVGVTQRPLVARGDRPELTRGRTAPIVLGGETVGRWTCTRTGVQPVVAHAGWRTSPDTAAETVLAASTGSARTPVPLQEARRVAREARSLGGG